MKLIDGGVDSGLSESTKASDDLPEEAHLQVIQIGGDRSNPLVGNECAGTDLMKLIVDVREGLVENGNVPTRTL